MRSDCDYLWPPYKDGYAARAVALIGDLFIGIALPKARGTLNSALDVVVRHVERSTLIYGEPKARVGCRVRAADTCRDSDLA